MSSAKYYYNAYMYLWAVLSSFHFMFDDYMTPEMGEKIGVWIRSHTQFGNVVPDKANEAFKSIPTDDIKWMSEDELDNLVWEVASQLKTWLMFRTSDDGQEQR